MSYNREIIIIINIPNAMWQGFKYPDRGYLPIFIKRPKKGQNHHIFQMICRKIVIFSSFLAHFSSFSPEFPINRLGSQRYHNHLAS